MWTPPEVLRLMSAVEKSHAVQADVRCCCNKLKKGKINQESYISGTNPKADSEHEYFDRFPRAIKAFQSRAPATSHAPAE